MSQPRHRSLGSSRTAGLAWALALITLLGFGGVGALLIAIGQDRSPMDLIAGPWAWPGQLALGAGLGGLVGRLAWAWIATPTMATARLRYARLAGTWFPGQGMQLVVSVCAGVGEELFFRGALQHWLGIPATAVLFVAVHGYLNPNDAGMLRYGAGMVLVFIGLGWLSDTAGLLVPVTAHAVIDAVLLNRLVAAWRAERHPEGQSCG